MWFTVTELVSCGCDAQMKTSSATCLRDKSGCMRSSEGKYIISTVKYMLVRTVLSNLLLNVKSLPSHVAYRAALASDIALSQASAEDAIPWIWDKCVARCACLLPSLRWYKFNCLETVAMCVNNFPRSHSTVQRLGLNP